MRNTGSPADGRAASNPCEESPLGWALNSTLEGLSETDRHAVTTLCGLTGDDMFRIASSALRARECCGLGVGILPARLAILERITNDMASLLAGRPLPTDPAMAEEALVRLEFMVEAGCCSLTDENYLNVHFTGEYGRARLESEGRPGRPPQVRMPPNMVLDCD